MLSFSVSTYFHRLRSAFTILEVMVATLILAIGISAALDAIYNNNSLRRSLDENTMVDLVLRQMTARLKTTNITELGHVYQNSDGSAQAWTLHLRATASTNVPAASTSASALAQPYSSPASYIGPYQPLTQQDLIAAGILREMVAIDNLTLYVEYYNLSTITGLQNISGALVPVENGLIQRYNQLQDANPTGVPRQIWQSLVGDPTTSPPTDSEVDAIIMPATFSLTNIDQPGTPEQIRGAFNHGFVIRILASWRPSEILNPNSTYLRWRETVLVKRN